MLSFAAIKPRTRENSIAIVRGWLAPARGVCNSSRVSAHIPFDNPARFEAALRRFDEENAKDPNHETVNGVAGPRELVYAKWLTDWVLKLRPDASEELRLAARCQHLCRWTIARESYPMT